MTLLSLGIMEVSTTIPVPETVRCRHIANIAQTIVKQRRNAKSPRAVRGRRARRGNGEPETIKTIGNKLLASGAETATRRAAPGPRRDPCRDQAAPTKIIGNP